MISVPSETLILSISGHFYTIKTQNMTFLTKGRRKPNLIIIAKFNRHPNYESVEMVDRYSKKLSKDVIEIVSGQNDVITAKK